MKGEEENKEEEKEDEKGQEKGDAGKTNMKDYFEEMAALG